ncbi:hypothetical protein J31TS4_18750 [Paenibacillus sp. J31TS4]|uniref:hypothetical protein n=1 Tax=Paenibacillus sp. J31TS4 TaxID=2807195 RepID=UPI001B296E4F|nr:hypothetical protein [Paenibacillus sp. J31TS4]GIP38595.1 hypothetical protein J31TS4_18750 [Paenibacillus sp. J31TS4]
MPLIKSDNVNLVPEPLMIPIQIPILDTFHNARKKAEKLLEELDELTAEACAELVDIDHLLEEFYDVAQVIAGLLLARFKEKVSFEDAVQLTRITMMDASAKHLDKMEHRAVERGWMIAHE